jgi:hypothetical protein
MPYNGGKSKTLATKRHFTVVIGNKENGLLSNIFINCEF